MTVSTRHVTYRVTTTGSTAAVQEAKDRAHAEGLKVRTVASVHQVTPHVRDNRKERLDWDVTLAVRS